MSHPVETYLHDIVEVRRSGAGTKETSYYGALSSLLNAVGKDLKPKVRCIVQLASQGSGHPDLGLFTADQFQRGGNADPQPGQKPSRGVIEAKASSADVRKTARTEQVKKYLAAYGVVLVTNFRDFLVVGRDPATGSAAELEEFSFAVDENIFWRDASNPRRMADAIGDRAVDFLRRALLQVAPLTQPSDVAWFLASYAREALARVEEADLPALDAVRVALEGSLGIKFADEKGERFFRSTLVQTIFYGIFSSWILWAKDHPPSSGARFDWHSAAWYLRVPMISQLFEQVATRSRLEPLGLVEVLDWTATALNRVDRAAFFGKFQEEHAVQYFYEPFLQAFDPQLRKELGVWYTPPEVVKYMVGRVDQALRRDLRVEDGLADPRVHVLDPCAGTGAYLVEVLEKIAETLRENTGGSALDMVEVREAAKKRLHGFELLPAPFVVSHLQLGLVLQRLGVPLGEGDRVGVYLTNALTGWQPPTEEGKKRLAQLELPLPGLKEEREAADSIKRDAPILVILGNPPYNGFAGLAVEEERDLSDAYRTTKKAPKPQGQGLNDLYVRFFRMAERKIVEDSGRGVVCFISNYSWLDGLSFTGMRERYVDVFDRVTVDNLHGDRIISEVAPDGRASETVFAMRGQSSGIKVGTAIVTLVRQEEHQEVPTIEYRDYHDSWAAERRQALLDALVDGAAYESVEPILELGLPFKPRVMAENYINWPEIPDLFPFTTPGIITARDELLVAIDREDLERRLAAYFDDDVDDATMARLVPAAMKETGRFPAKTARRTLLRRGILPDRVVRYVYRPFDVRWFYWEPETKLVEEKRAEAYPHFVDDNIWLVSGQRQRKGFHPPMVVRTPCSFHLIENSSNLFPLKVMPEKKEQEDLFAEGVNMEAKPNISSTATSYLKAIKAKEDDLFYHVLAIQHAPVFYHENDQALRQDWPRVPLPATKKVLESSSKLGHEVAALLDTEAEVKGVTSGKIRPELRPFGVFTLPEGHTLDEDRDFAITARWGYTGRGGITMPARGDLRERDNGVPEDLQPLLGTKCYDVMLNDKACWSNVPERVWEYTLGGYQVVKKWLSYREQELLGRPLRIDEVRYVEQMIRRITALLLLASALDENYATVKAKTYEWEKASKG